MLGFPLQARAAVRPSSLSSPWVVVARGNLSTPFWSVESPDGLVTLGRESVAASRLGNSAHGEENVSVPVSLVLSRTHRSFYRVPPGWAILDIAASSSGVLLTEGPIQELGATAFKATVWHLVSLPWFGQPRIRLSSAKHGGRTGIADLAVTGEFWGALILYTPAGGRVPSAAFLAEGEFDRSAILHIHYTAGGYLPTSLALTAQGEAVVGALAYFGSGVGDVPFPHGANVLAEWTASGVLVPGPGGVYAVNRTSVRKILAQGASRLIITFPTAETVSWVAGSASSLVVVLDRRGGPSALWVMGRRPRGFSLAGITGMDGITVTANGVALVAIGFARDGLVLRARGWPMG